MDSIQNTTPQWINTYKYIPINVNNEEKYEKIA